MIATIGMVVVDPRSWVEGRDAAEGAGQSPQQRSIQIQMSIMLLLRSPTGIMDNEAQRGVVTCPKSHSTWVQAGPAGQTGPPDSGRSGWETRPLC